MANFNNDCFVINIKVQLRVTVGNVDRDIGRYSVDSRSTPGRQSVDIAVDSWSTVGRGIGYLSSYELELSKS